MGMNSQCVLLPTAWFPSSWTIAAVSKSNQSSSHSPYRLQFSFSAKSQETAERPEWSISVIIIWTTRILNLSASSIRFSLPVTNTTEFLLVRENISHNPWPGCLWVHIFVTTHDYLIFGFLNTPAGDGAASHSPSSMSARLCHYKLWVHPERVFKRQTASMWWIRSPRIGWIS